jgi:hypothetical protein
MSDEEQVEDLRRVLQDSALKRKIELEEFTAIYQEREKLLKLLEAVEALGATLNDGHEPGTSEYSAALNGVLDAARAYHVPVRGADKPSRTKLGRIVRETWVRWAKKQPDPKPSWLVPWEHLDSGQREVDMLIGAAVAQYIIANWSLLLNIAGHAKILWQRRNKKPAEVFEFLNRLRGPLLDLYPSLRNKP